MGTTSYALDAGGWITEVANPNGTVFYAFYSANRRTSMTLSGTGNWAYSYDAKDRLTQIVNPSSETKTFSYDDANCQHCADVTALKIVEE